MLDATGVAGRSNPTRQYSIGQIRLAGAGRTPRLRALSSLLAGRLRSPFFSPAGHHLLPRDRGIDIVPALRRSALCCCAGSGVCRSSLRGRVVAVETQPDGAASAVDHGGARRGCRGPGRRRWSRIRVVVRSFTTTYLAETVALVNQLPTESIEQLAVELAASRDGGGRLFILGARGSAGHASHAVNDFRKICGFEAYAPTDNVSELTARTNDDGWESVFAGWLKGSHLQAKDALLVFSVGGGNLERNISANLVKALELAKGVGAKIYGVVGRDGGYTAKIGDVVVVIPPLYGERITPHTEGLAAVVWHLLVSHPCPQK